MHESWIVGSYIVDPFDHDIYVEWRYNYVQSISLRKKSSYWELFWYAFFPHFPAFGLNTERYFVSFRIWDKCGPEQLRIRTLFTQCKTFLKFKFTMNLPFFTNAFWVFQTFNHVMQLIFYSLQSFCSVILWARTSYFFCA